MEEQKQELLPKHTTETDVQETTIRRNASWGAIISIIVILLMVIVGAFYAWGERLDQQRQIQVIEHSSNI